MTDEASIRAIVRETLARHLAAASAPAPPGTGVPLGWRASHARYPVLSGEQGDGPCLIEPAVRCHHCGYCQSHGY